MSSGASASSDMMSSLFSGNESNQTSSMTSSTAQKPVEDSARTVESEHSTTKSDSLPLLTLTNFVSGEKETFQPIELTVDKAQEFVPPIEKSQMIFSDLIDNGKEPYVALMMTYTFLESELEKSGTIE